MSAVHEGLEVVPVAGKTSVKPLSENDEGKVFINAGGHTPYYSSKASDYLSETSNVKAHVHLPWWRRKRWYMIGILLLMILAVVIPIAVLVPRKSASNGQSISSNRNSTSASIGTLPAVTGSVNSIIQNTRMARLVTPSSSEHMLFYQAGNGRLRVVTASSVGNWQGVLEDPLPADDALPGTPLTSRPGHEIDNDTNLYLFYIDKNYTIQNLYRNDSEGFSWQKGNIGDKQYKVIQNQTTLAFGVYSGNKYNPALYNGEGGVDGGLTLIATGSDGLIHEYIYDVKQDLWREGFTFDDSQGRGGASAGYVYGLGYMIAHKDDTLGIWYKDYKDSQGDKWSSGPTSPSADQILQESSVCTSYFFVTYQGDNGDLRGNNCTGDAASNMQWNSSFLISDRDVSPGTAISCWGGYPSDSEIWFSIVYQKNSRDMEEAYLKVADQDASKPNLWNFRTPLRQAA